MKCRKCGEEVADGKTYCSNCGTKIVSEESVRKITLKQLLIFIVIIVFIIAVVTIMILKGKDLTNVNNEDTTKVEQVSANMQIHGNSSISFENMKNKKDEYSEEQKAILDYFDDDYFELYSNCEELQRYPEVFKNAKIAFNIVVKKVLKSDSDEFVVIGYLCDLIYGDNEIPLEEIETSRLIVVKGTQLSKRLIENDGITVYGRYIDTDTYETNGKTYILPTVESLKIVEDNYSADTITTVAKAIFGNDIKISTPEIEESYDDPYGIYGTENPDNFYVITLDNQSNSNFKYFDIYTNRTNISYDPKYNNIADGTIKKLFISSDFEHFIVSTYDSGLKHVYIEYYDREYNKLWMREFSYNSDIINYSPMDYTTDKMAVVVDNDLYLIDLENGEDVIEPVIISSSIERVNMMSDGILLIGTDSKDTIMKVDYNGNILYRNNVSLSEYTVYDMYMQVVNNKIVIVYDVYMDYDIYTGEGGRRFKYVVLNNDGTIELET